MKCFGRGDLEPPKSTASGGLQSTAPVDSTGGAVELGHFSPRKKPSLCRLNPSFHLKGPLPLRCLRPASTPRDPFLRVLEACLHPKEPLPHRCLRPSSGWKNPCFAPENRPCSRCVALLHTAAMCLALIGLVLAVAGTSDTDIWAVGTQRWHNDGTYPGVYHDENSTWTLEGLAPGYTGNDPAVSQVAGDSRSNFYAATAVGVFKRQ